MKYPHANLPDRLGELSVLGPLKSRLKSRVSAAEGAGLELPTGAGGVKANAS